jgi:preprotein translocase subunit SecA
MRGIKILGEDHAKEIEKRIFLQSIDLNWKSHIQYLEQLRQVIGLRSYGQRDPLVEYKKEAFDLFSNLLEKLKLDFVTILMNLKSCYRTTRRKKRVNGRIKLKVVKKLAEMNLAHADQVKNLSIAVVLYKFRSD